MGPPSGALAKPTKGVGGVGTSSPNPGAETGARLVNPPPPPKNRLVEVEVVVGVTGFETTLLFDPKSDFTDMLVDVVDEEEVVIPATVSGGFVEKKPSGRLVAKFAVPTAANRDVVIVAGDRPSPVPPTPEWFEEVSQ